MHFFERLFHFERRHEALASPATLRERLRYNAMVAGGLLLFSLALGVLGFRYIVGDEHWVDAFYSASMLLSGMGPADTPPSPAGKLFAGFYALYSGAIFLIAAAVIVAPVFHRVMHHFHLKSESEHD